MPKVSIIIPTYNRADLLPATLQSVFNQSFRDFEVIVVDDGSSDETRDVLETFVDPRLTFIYQDKSGRSAARNYGWKISQAPLTVFLDSDDLLLPDALGSLFKGLLDCPDVGAIGGGFLYIDERGCLLGEAQAWLNDQLDLSRWLVSCPFSIGGVIVRSEWLKKVGGFDTCFDFAEDWDLWLRMVASGCLMKWIKRPLFKYRLHSTRSSVNAEKHTRSSIQILDKYFAQDPIPPEALCLRRESYGWAHVYGAAREFGAGQIEAAKLDLLQASQYMPEWIDTGVLLETLLHNSQNPLVTFNPEGFRATVLENLPQEVQRAGIYRRALGRLAARNLFDSYRHQNWSQVRHFWIKTILYDPSWLNNRGVLSIGIRGITHNKIFSRISGLFNNSNR